jgi:tetratricopeptide (TPR) repeat protein
VVDAVAGIENVPEWLSRATRESAGVEESCEGDEPSNESCSSPSIRGAQVISDRQLREGVREAMKMSWVTLDRICEEQMRSDAKIRRLFEDSNRPLRSRAAQLSDEELWARIGVCEHALGRFPNEDQLMVENRRRAVAESLFELGETDAADSLFEQWLAVDRRWGWGWIGWADLHSFTNRRPKNYDRAEELLRRGYSTPGVRDKEDIAERLAHLYEETGRGNEALEFADHARRVSAAKSGISVRRTVDLVDAGDHAAVRDNATISFRGEGLPLDRLEEIVTALDAARRPARATKVGRNAPCPCGSGRKYKKCCGSGQAGDR